MRRIDGVRVPRLAVSRGVSCALVAMVGTATLLAVPAAADAHTATDRHVRAAIGFDQNEVNPLSCPSAKQCTALTPTGEQVTFNPTHGGKVITARLFPATENARLALDCVSTTLCVAVDGSGVVVGFDPKRKNAKPKYTTTLTGASYQTSVSCPSKSLCVFDSYQAEGYINPSKKSSMVSNSFAANQTGANPSATCISTTYCVGSNGNSGLVYTFNPKAPAKAKSTTITSTPAVGEISCTSGKQCTAVTAFHGDYGLGVMTFNPHKVGSKPKIRGLSQSSESDIACATKTYCEVGGYDAGVYSYDTKTRRHKFSTLPYTTDSAAFAAIACPSKTECVAIMTDGKKVVLNPAKPPKVLKLKGLTKKA
jgi:hypothetical protein